MVRQKSSTAVAVEVSSLKKTKLPPRDTECNYEQLKQPIIKT